LVIIIRNTFPFIESSKFCEGLYENDSIID
jgi:hypothetical protein